MKTPVKFNISTVFALILLFALGVMLTGRSMSEEKSKLGNTAISVSDAVTYVKDCDASIEMPKDWKRYFQDTENSASYYMKKNEIMLMTMPDDQEHIMEMTVKSCADVLGTDAVNGLEDLSEAQKEAFANWVLEELRTPTDNTSVLDSDFETQYIEENGRTFLNVHYRMKSTAYAEFQFSQVYATVVGGSCVIMDCYTTGKDGAKYADGLRKLQAWYEPVALSMQPGDLTKSMKSASADSPWAKLTSFTFGIWVFFIPVIYIAICGMQVVDKNYVPTAEEYQTYEYFQPQPLGLKNSKSVLGLFAVLIVFHHLAQTIGEANASAFNILEHFGVGLVSLFFFFSGYGLLKSVQSKEGYLKGFFRKRLTTVLIPFYMSVLVFMVRYLVSGTNRSLKQGLLYATGLELINSHAWYIVEIVIFYVVFYLIYRFVKNRKVCLWLMFAFIVGFVVFCMTRGHGNSWFQGEWWYNTSLVFWIGMLVANKEEAIIRFMKKIYKVLLPVLIVLFVVLARASAYMLSHHGYWTETVNNMRYEDKIPTLLVQFSMCIVFTFLMITVFLKVRFENPVLTFLGNISLELYLIHNLFLQMFGSVKGVGMYTLFVIAASIAVAALLHEIDARLICLVQGRKYVKKKAERTSDTDWAGMAKLNIRLNLQYAKRHPGRVGKLCLRTVVCSVLSVIAIGPVYIMYINATRTHQSLVRGISLLPEGHFQENLAQFKDYASNLASGLFQSLFYSCFIAATAAILAVYFGCMCAYGFEIFDFKGKKGLWRVVVAALMMSPIGSFLGFYRLVMKMGMLNTFYPLILPSIATPAVAYFMRMYFQTVRLKDIVEAARIDGSSEFGIFNKIILPAVKPALSLQMIFTFVNVWNNSFYHGMILQRPEKKTIAMFLKTFASNPGCGSDPVVYTILLMAILPPVIVYILFSKSIVSQIVIGAVKE